MLDGDLAAGGTLGVELHAIAGDLVDLAISDHDVAPMPRDAMGILLVFEGAVEEVMDVAVLDGHVLAEDADAVAGAVVNLAIAQRDVTGSDLHNVPAGALGIHNDILVDPWLRDLEAMNDLWVGKRADLARGAGEAGRLCGPDGGS